MDYTQMTDAQLIALLHDPRAITILLILAIWDLAWRGTALWKASRNNSIPWFVAIMVLNTVGVLPIIYIFFFSKKKDNPAA